MFSLYHAEILADVRRKELEHEARLHRMLSARERRTVAGRLSIVLVWVGKTMVTLGERLQCVGLRTTVPVANPLSKTVGC